MRDLSILDDFRVKTPDILEQFGSYGDDTCGAFMVPYPKTGVRLKVLASANGGWDHISVSLTNRCPNHLELTHVKHLFFKPHETAWQYFTSVADHIDVHPYCLHLWRSWSFDIPMPPREFV